MTSFMFGLHVSELKNNNIVVIIFMICYFNLLICVHVKYTMYNYMFMNIMTFVYCTVYAIKYVGWCVDFDFLVSDEVTF